MRLVKWIWVLPLLLGVTNANEVFVNTQSGQMYVVNVDLDESIGVFQDRLSVLTGDEAFTVAIPSKKRKWAVEAGTQGGYLGRPREYTCDVTPEEKCDIHYVVTSLANKSLISIALMKGSLESAGDRIDHVHPLRFLMTIFTDEELKVGIRNIRGRGWIWNAFISSIKDTLSTEDGLGNLKDEYICHFAQVVGIDYNRIYPFIVAQDWDGFVEVLIHEVPRKGNHDRYDN